MVTTKWKLLIASVLLAGVLFSIAMGKDGYLQGVAAILVGYLFGKTS